MIRNVIRLVLAVLAFSAFSAFAAVDVNQANRADLETVKGIGPGLSGKIVDARKTGSFKDWGDLVERVGGIGPGNAARFSQNGLTVGGATFDGKPVAAMPAKEAKAKKVTDKGADKRADKTSEKPGKAS